MNGDFYSVLVRLAFDGDGPMRIALCLLALLSATPASAGPFSACDFISQAEVERMLGGSTEPPVVRDMNICTGACAGLNTTSCEFHTLGPGARRQLEMDITLPPYMSSARADRAV